MKVKATQLGYYNHQRRREGDVFQLNDEKSFSSKWMEKVEAKPKGKVETKSKATRKEASSNTEVI